MKSFYDIVENTWRYIHSLILFLSLLNKTHMVYIVCDLKKKE